VFHFASGLPAAARTRHLVGTFELLPTANADGHRDGVASVKDVWKWINGPYLVTALHAPFDQKSSFEVVLSFVYSRNDDECGFLFKLFPNVFQRRKRNRHGWEVFNRSNVARAISDTSAAVFRRHFSCPPSRPSMAVTVSPISCQHSALYIGGRYNKFSRTLSQTPWLIGGVRKTESSVEEYICEPVAKVVMATEYRFSASGREDVDVRMLGDGRPFVIELINPRRVVFTRQQLRDLQETINKSTVDIAVRHLQVVSKDDTTVLKEGEEEKRKRYVALCWSRDPVTDNQLSALESIKDLALAQKTPIRVLHRRSLATRERTVYNMSAQRVISDDPDIASRHFVVSLTTQAGTYVKEFVHGDLGRTVPSLGVLLNTECDILALDVMAVELDWPKPVDNVDGDADNKSAAAEMISKLK
jgi:tRNA pseudouridine synthase 10